MLAVQVLGGAAAALLVRRLAAVPTLLAGAALLAVLVLALPASAAAARFVLLCAAFGFTWLFVMPFHIRLAFGADPAGRIAVLVPAAQLIGSAFGPLLASLFVSGDEAGAVPLVSAALAFASTAALLLGARRRAAG